MAATEMPDKVRGVVLLNSAGQFGDANMEKEESEETGIAKYFLKPVKEIFQRVVLGFLFWQAKRPARIESVLKSVRHIITYPYRTHSLICCLPSGKSLQCSCCRQFRNNTS